VASAELYVGHPISFVSSLVGSFANAAQACIMYACSCISGPDPGRPLASWETPRTISRSLPSMCRCWGGCRAAGCPSRQSIGSATLGCHRPHDCQTRSCKISWVELVPTWGIQCDNLGVGGNGVVASLIFVVVNLVDLVEGNAPKNYDDSPAPASLSRRRNLN
jgi:hypothetical protein